MRWSHSFCPGSCNPFSFIFLEASGWLPQGLQLHISVGISGHLNVPGLHAAFCSWQGRLLPSAAQFCNVAGKLHLLADCGSVNVTLLSGMPWPEQYKEWNIKYVCPWIGLSMMGTSHAGSYLLGTLCAFNTRWLEAKLTFCEKGWKAWFNHILLSPIGGMLGAMELGTQYGGGTKELLTKSRWVLPRKALHLGDTSAGPANRIGFCQAGKWKRVIQANVQRRRKELLVEVCLNPKVQGVC